MRPVDVRRTVSTAVRGCGESTRKTVPWIHSARQRRDTRRPCYDAADLSGSSPHRYVLTHSFLHDIDFLRRRPTDGLYAVMTLGSQ